ncbi:hypothetical protein MKW94_009746 [Papaver nudicaule]|uniref:Defective in cullin neddylation protein n=1 Tax=Papaver nudicaule TaxID=74823 RepID=A0AA41SK62_PAPNU|nr:hypothetical protein [Papaver nudicaule]
MGASKDKRKKEETANSRRSKKLKSEVVTAEGSLFKLYANKATNMIEPEGVESLCSDLGMEHTDVRILMLAWKMSAAKMGYFTRDEWQNGLEALKANNMNKLSKKLTKLEKKIKQASDNKFMRFYSYAFQYCLTEDMQKNVDKETVCQLLDMVLASRFPDQVGKLVEYLKCQTDYKVINRDQWLGFYRFCNEISFPDMANYDEANGTYYPSIIDYFVDWMKQEKS